MFLRDFPNKNELIIIGAKKGAKYRLALKEPEKKAQKYIKEGPKKEPKAIRKTKKLKLSDF